MQKNSLTATSLSVGNIETTIKAFVKGSKSLTLKIIENTLSQAKKLIEDTNNPHIVNKTLILIRYNFY